MNESVIVDGVRPEGALSPGIRIWPLPLTLGLEVVVWYLLKFLFNGDFIEGWHRAVYSQISLVVTFFLLVIWFVFYSRLAWTIRRRGTIFVGCICLIFLGLVRLEGYTGDMWMILGPRWVSRDTSVTPDGQIEEIVEQREDSPQFLGRDRLGRFDSRLNPDWNSHPPQELWRRPIGEGFSSFAVLGDLAITQQQAEGNELVVCYQLEPPAKGDKPSSGVVFWKHEDSARSESALGGIGPRATPTIHEGRVYTLGATGILNCLELKTGKKFWSHDVMEETDSKPQMWGVSCSPLIVENRVIVSTGDATSEEKHSTLVAYDRNSGRELWRAGEDNASYCSPTLATIAGSPQILIVTSSTIVGHDVATGEILWEYPWPGSFPHVAQAVSFSGDRVFVSKGYSTGSVMLQIQRDKGGKWSAEEIWRNKRLMKTKFTNVVVRDHYAFGLSDGKLECIDTDKGKKQWKVRGDYGQGQVILLGDHLLIQCESGDVALVRADPEKHEEVARFSPLSDRTWNCPVVVGDLLLVRNDKEAACYRLTLAEE